MGTIKRFEDIECWQLARELNKNIYPLLVSLNDKRNYALNGQMDRSAGSIMDNIAEGFERDGNREFVQFLSVAKGSAGELRSQLYRALDRELLNMHDFERYQESCLKLGNKIGSFMNYLNQAGMKGKKFNR